jgi:16S rRNA C967 or C1407 C5-methylase (RsmB/RsmF family)
LITQVWVWKQIFFVIAAIGTITLVPYSDPIGCHLTSHSDERKKKSHLPYQYYLSLYVEYNEKGEIIFQSIPSQAPLPIIKISINIFHIDLKGAPGSKEWNRNN